LQGTAATRYIILAALMLASVGFAFAIDISEVGNWAVNVDANDLISGAGSDLTSTYESSADQGLIAITGTTGDSDNWRVDVRRSDTSWHGDLTLFVKRTGDGTGSGSISDGTAYQAVTTTDTALFSGSGDRSNIPVQLKISGASVAIPPSAYATSIIYTVVDTQ
jgi:hypothetical protein